MTPVDQAVFFAGFVIYMVMSLGMLVLWVAAMILLFKAITRDFFQ